jgi:hypothetical protein
LDIETVYQDLALCDSVANLFLGRELVGPGLPGSSS